MRSSWRKNNYTCSNRIFMTSARVALLSLSALTAIASTSPRLLGYAAANAPLHPDEGDIASPHERHHTTVLISSPTKPVTVDQPLLAKPFELIASGAGNATIYMDKQVTRLPLGALTYIYEHPYLTAAAGIALVTCGAPLLTSYSLGSALPPILTSTLVRRLVAGAALTIANDKLWQAADWFSHQYLPASMHTTISKQKTLDEIFKCSAKSAIMKAIPKVGAAYSSFKAVKLWSEAVHTSMTSGAIKPFLKIGTFMALSAPVKTVTTFSLNALRKSIFGL